jgi:hypothetical protein
MMLASKEIEMQLDKAVVVDVRSDGLGESYAGWKHNGVKLEVRWAVMQLDRAPSNLKSQYHVVKLELWRMRRRILNRGNQVRLSISTRLG